MASEKELVRVLLQEHGRTYSDEIGFEVADTPRPLFGLLVASLLFSARISADIAVRAARALRAEGWTTAQKLSDAGWSARTRTLNASGYARYDERTSTMLGDTCDLVLERYGGDLRRLRDLADRDPGTERRLLKECKGIGDVGVDIFFREVQGVWDELFPFLDERTAAAAGALGLPTDAGALAALVPSPDYPRLVTALVRVDLADDQDRIERLARGEEPDGENGDRPPTGTKEELYAQAQDHDIPGRSTMSKDELAEALDGEAE